jgi:hypothetical protein
LKLECDESLSNFAFKFNLRHYTAADDLMAAAMQMSGLGGAVQVDSIKTRVESAAWFQFSA